VGFWVPVLKGPAPAGCDHTPLQAFFGSTYNANVVDLQHHEYWDIEHAEAAGNPDLDSWLDTIVADANKNGVLWPEPDGSHVVLQTALTRGQQFPGAGSLPPNAQLVNLGTDETGAATQGVLINTGAVNGQSGYLLAWQALDGLILYQNVNVQPVSGSATAVNKSGVFDLLAKVMAGWTSTVRKLPGDFPETPSETGVVGTALHQAIALYYESENAGNTVFSNNDMIRQILTEPPLAGQGDLSKLNEDQMKLKPDILNATLRVLYEIKPVGQYAAGIRQMVKYLTAFKQAGVADPEVTAGAIGAAGTYGILPVSGGYAVFGTPQPGIILYQLVQGDFKPSDAAGDQQSSFARILANAALSAALVVGGAVVAGEEIVNGVLCVITFCWAQPVPGGA
jgi:hypothetical protein